MTPIHELLNRIRCDKDFGQDRFEVGYHDRQEDALQRVAFQEIVFPAAARLRAVRAANPRRDPKKPCIYGGIGRTGGVCGAVSGGVLGINLVAGRSQASQSPESNHRLVRTFLSQFEAQFGTTTCERLIGCRLDTPEGQRFFKENNLRETKCQVFTREAARMVSASVSGMFPAQPLITTTPPG